MIRVLVVEDDPDDAVLTRAYLEEATRHDFQAQFAANPQQALTLMLTGHHDVCLLDYMLGATDGLSLYSEAKAEGYSAPVILLTGQGDADVAEVALERGVSDFLEKGRVDSSILERAISYSLERKRAEQEILKLNVNLEQRVQERTQQLMALNRELEAFSYSIAHDLAGPLRSICGTSRILIEDHADQLDAEGIELLRRQEAAGLKLSVLISELLKLSRLSRQEMQWSQVDLTELATEIAQELSTRERPNAIQFEIQPSMEGRGDRSLLFSVLQNLMENACKFSPNGGKVTIGMRREGRESVFFVADEGVGFNMAYAEKVFVPFERLVTEAEFPGTGIGLASVERIILRHGGRVWVDSKPGEGTTFFFTLAP